MGWDVHPGLGRISFVPDGTWVRRAWNPAMNRWATLPRPSGCPTGDLTENSEEPAKTFQRVDLSELAAAGRGRHSRAPALSGRRRALSVPSNEKVASNAVEPAEKACKVQNRPGLGTAHLARSVGLDSPATPGWNPLLRPARRCG